MSQLRPVLAAGLAVAVTCAFTAAQPAAIGPRVIEIARHKQQRIHRMAFSPDGAALAVMGYPLFGGSEVLTLWSVPDGRHLRTFRGDAAGEGFDFSPDGKLLATPVGKGGEVVICDVASGKELRRLRHPGVDRVKFSPAGKHLLSDNWRSAGQKPGDELRVWDYDTGRRVFTAARTRHETPELIQFATDGRLFFGESYARVQCWDPTTGAARPAVRLVPDADYRVTLSPTGRDVASENTKTSQFHLRDATTGKIKHDLSRKFVSWMGFTRDGRLLILAIESGRIEVWDTATGARRSEFTVPPVPRGATLHAEPFPDGRHLLVQHVYWGNTNLVYDQTTVYTVEGRLVRRALDTRDIAFDPSGRSVAVLEGAPVPPGQPGDLRVMLYDAAAWLAGGAKKD
jgi:WD40 repeat protein